MEDQRGVTPPTFSNDLAYRIGSQVHDHEARIRLLERESVVLSESVKQIRASLDEIMDRIAGIDRHLQEHVEQENKDRAKLIAASVGQFLTVIVGVIMVSLGK